MAGKSPAKIGSLMGISEQLAELNHERFQNWEVPFTTDNARQALLAFDGDVYIGMDARNRFSAADYTRAQKTLRILSGLYGLLRPLDLMMPYRLEMGTKLKTERGKDLYQFWGETSPGDEVLINLASNEYFKSVRKPALTAPIVTPAFLDAKGSGDYKIVAFFAKKARGSMAGWMIRNKIDSVADLQAYDELGYAFDKERSTEDRPVFTRRKAD